MRILPRHLDGAPRGPDRAPTHRSHRRGQLLSTIPPPRQLVIGDRVVVAGGFDHEPSWLANRPDGCAGIVVEFIPGQNEQPAAVVELDGELFVPDGARGRFLVLELGHLGTDWATPMPRVHVELCADRPEPKRWQDRRQGAWVESHATYARRPPP